jgi:ABC-type sugar transport system ATPase subunit
MADIELRKVTKRFDQLVAVDAVDLDVAAGEVVCLLGPSGCGKTTTLRMIAGLEYATEGEIRLAGRPVNHLAARERDVAMAFQFYALYPSLSVRDNLAFPLHAEGAGADEIARRVRHVSEVLQLGHVLERKPHQLAEGEKQRVAVGRSIIRDAVCFLFDEPLSRLDVQLRETMRGQIKEVLAQLNKATVIVTHDQLEALTMANRIAVMRAGRIEQIASPHDIFARPANLFVAGFIGTPQMNLIEAVVERRTEHDAMLKAGSQQISLALDGAGDSLAEGSTVTLGIRPRAFELIDQPDPTALAATVDIIEPMGAETLLHLVADGNDLRAVVDRRIRADVGAKVHVRLRRSQTHLFDADGNRVALPASEHKVPA